MPIAPLDGDCAEVEQDERLIRPVLQLFLKDPRIAIEFSGPQGEVNVARMPDDQVRPPDGNPGPAQGGHDLLMDAIGPADVVAAGKQPDMIDDGLAAAAVGAGVAGAAHDISRRLVRPQSVEELLELLPLGRIDHIVGVEPEGVIAGGVGEPSFRAAAKSSIQVKSNTRAPNSWAISTVRSFDPVSTTTISSKIPRTDSRQCGRLSCSSRTIMVRLTRSSLPPVAGKVVRRTG